MRTLFSTKICNHFNVKISADVDFNDKYNYIIDEIGLDNCKRFLPYNKEKLEKLYHRNKHFNNNDIKKWDAAGQSLLYCYASKLNIYAWSIAQGTCTIKQVARRILEV